MANDGTVVDRHRFSGANGTLTIPDPSPGHYRVVEISSPPAYYPHPELDDPNAAVTSGATATVLIYDDLAA